MKAYNKSIVREFKQSITRFLSILSIIFLGVGFYVGIRSTGPDMLETAQAYYTNTNLMDMHIVSTMGLTNDDLTLLSSNKEIEAIDAGYSEDVFYNEDHDILHIASLPTNGVSELYLVEGTLPKQPNDIVLDTKLQDIYTIGDELSITKEENSLLKNDTYQVVGFVNSPLYITNVERGYTSLGKGSIDVVGYTPSSNFTQDVYTDIFLTFYNTKALVPYSEEYNTQMEQNEESISKLLSNRPKERLEEVLQDAKATLDETNTKLTIGEQELAAAKLDVAQGRAAYQDGLQQYEKGVETFEQTLEEHIDSLTTSNKQLDTQFAAYDTALLSLQQKETQLNEVAVQLDSARQSLIDHSLDPDADLTQLETQLSMLQTQMQTLQTLADDVKQQTLPIEQSTLDTWQTILQQDSTFQSLQPFLDQLYTDSSSLTYQDAFYNGILELKDTLTTTYTSLQNAYTMISTYQTNREAYDEGMTALENGKVELETTHQYLLSARHQIESSLTNINELLKTGSPELQATKQLLDATNTRLLAGEAEIAKNERTLTEGRQAYEDGLKQLEKMNPPTYYQFTRDDNPGYAEFYDNTLRISSIADIVPIFFFGIAALISLTTMTRMVDEKRGEIGTMKGLGYTNKQIAKKFLVYAAASTTLGIVFGVLIGGYIFPTLIYQAYQILYNIGDFKVLFYPTYIIQSIVLSFACTLLATYTVIRGLLKEAPSTLMLPKAPKAGKKIFLERIPIVWNHLSFSFKVTFRNVFRYKQRMVMTILGIAGCTGLMLTGFGLKDSIGDVTVKQFDDIWTYQALITLNEDASTTNMDDLQSYLSDSDFYQDSMSLYQESFNIEGATEFRVNVLAVDDTTQLESYVQLKDRKTQQPLTIEEDSVVLTEKLATELGLQVGDKITLQKDNISYPLMISGITENYIQHYIYTTKDTFTKNIHEIDKDTTILIKDNGSSYSQDEVAEDMMKSGAIQNVTFLSSTLKLTEDAMGSIDMVVLVLIVSAAILALVVLYNLSNINISERIRELSTIKVLGFYHREVTAYIYRETMILSILGIIGGFFVGYLLHTFVIRVVEVNDLMFSPNIHAISFLFATILTLIFTLLVMLIMHKKLKKIHMIDALKSVD